MDTLIQLLLNDFVTTIILLYTLHNMCICLHNHGHYGLLFLSEVYIRIFIDLLILHY